MDTSKQVGDPENIKVFAIADAAVVMLSQARRLV